MDPEARRNMWTVIEQVSAQRSVVLVTHSMEEVEALCTRMGVMVSGRLQCIGSAQHLKGRFGLGYQVEIRSIPARVHDCIALCERVMPSVAVEEVHGGYARLKVNKEVDLAAAFSALEEHKVALHILDYSISQCTLEQVFLKFAKDQEEETGHVAGLSSSGSQSDAKNGTMNGVQDGQQNGTQNGQQAEVVVQQSQSNFAENYGFTQQPAADDTHVDVPLFSSASSLHSVRHPQQGQLDEPEEKDNEFGDSTHQG